LDYGISEQLAELFNENARNSLDQEIAASRCFATPEAALFDASLERLVVRFAHNDVWPLFCSIQCCPPARAGRFGG
jgi:hypothetical protein